MSLVSAEQALRKAPEGDLAGEPRALDCCGANCCYAPQPTHPVVLAFLIDSSACKQMEKSDIMTAGHIII